MYDKLKPTLISIGLFVSIAASPPIWAQTDPQTIAIQQVIQKANAEQVQALATSDPSVMSDTATAAYYRQLVQINQDLTTQGATSINLVDLTWGAIDVSGSTATANTTETWTTTFSDSSTTQSTGVANVYTLQLLGGAWLIQADDQPATSVGQPAAAVSTPIAVVPTGNTSQNWSGYAVTGSGYTGITGTWTVPQPRVAGAPGVGATWVGIGGVTSHDLIQAGTQDVSLGAGQFQFQTWIEMLPAASQQVSLAVVPGDSITVSIDEQGAGTGMWQVSMKNNTSNQSFQTSVQYTSTESSAEWVEEAPAGSRGILPLDNFGSVSFTDASATQNGQAVSLADLGARPITMVNATKEALAVPSRVGGDGSSFMVVRTSATATAGRGGRFGAPATGQPGASSPAH